MPNLKIEVGRRYLDRRGNVYTIVRELLPMDPGYDKGYRFQGQMTKIEGDAAFQINTTVMACFKPNGQHIHLGVSSPSDLVSIAYLDLLTKDIQIGDEVGDIKGDIVVSGLFRDWRLTKKFATSAELFRATYGKFPWMNTDITAVRILAVESDADNHVRSALVMYSASLPPAIDSFYCALLSPPEDRA